MKEAGISADVALAALRQMMVTPVFTAHPTEVARQTVLLKRRRIAQQLEHLDRLPLTRQAKLCAANKSSTRKSLLSGRPTKSGRRKPTVDDEIRMGLRYFRLSLFETLPHIYSEVAEAIRDVYGRPSTRNLPNLLSFGSWIGGDRDGNPLVKPECITDALESGAPVILGEYMGQVEFLSDCLSSSCATDQRVRGNCRSAGAV